MNPISLFCILAGVSLNAGAQLLLKAGTNAVGHFEFTRANIIPVAWRLATQPPIIGGLACYVISVAVWVVGLSRVDVSIAYPMLSLGYVVNALSCWREASGNGTAPMTQKAGHDPAAKRETAHFL
jgi:multidrug transporter EmrE-like cation transporter